MVRKRVSVDRSIYLRNKLYVKIVTILKNVTQYMYKYNEDINANLSKKYSQITYNVAKSGELFLGILLYKVLSSLWIQVQVDQGNNSDSNGLGLN